MTWLIDIARFFLSLVAVLSMAILKYCIIPFYIFLAVCLCLIYKEREEAKEESKDGMAD